MASPGNHPKTRCEVLLKGPGAAESKQKQRPDGVASWLVPGTPNQSCSPEGSGPSRLVPTKACGESHHETKINSEGKSSGAQRGDCSTPGKEACGATPASALAQYGK